MAIKKKEKVVNKVFDMDKLRLQLVNLSFEFTSISIFSSAYLHCNEQAVPRRAVEIESNIKDLYERMDVEGRNTNSIRGCAVLNSYGNNQVFYLDRIEEEEGTSNMHVSSYTLTDKFDISIVPGEASEEDNECEASGFYEGSINGRGAIHLPLPKDQLDFIVSSLRADKNSKLWLDVNVIAFTPEEFLTEEVIIQNYSYVFLDKITCRAEREFKNVR